MHTRFAMIAGLLVVPILMFVSCGDGQPLPEEVAEPAVSHSPTAAHVVESNNVPTVVDTRSSSPALAPAPQLFKQQIPACTPVPGSSVDPCDPDPPPFAGGVGQSLPYLGDRPLSIREMIDDAPPLPPTWVSHLALRGTYLPDTVRCTAGNPFRPASYVRDVFGDVDRERSLKCYIDVRANAYILGSGPPVLTTLMFNHSYWVRNNPGQSEEHQTEHDRIEDLRRNIETAINEAFPGREHVMFLGPSIDLSVEAWRVIGFWDVQRRNDGAVGAVHPDRDLWASSRPDEYQTHLSKLEMELPEFTEAVTTAHQARVTEYEGRIGADSDLPMLVNNANQLRDYYTEVGAYAPDIPAPTQPPPPCGLAVPNQADNPGLMRDCFNLLAAKDALQGTATLNWSVDTAITDWDGVRVLGSPSRVTELNLSSSDLTGTIPPDLGRLDGLEFIRLVNNQLTGAIPAELGSLASLRAILASDNQLTGAIPPELGGLSGLEELWLHRNDLSGEIPATLGDLSNLKDLLLAENRLSGAIPSDLGDLTNLEELKLNYNQLTGEIPAVLAGLGNLTDLLLGNNELTGCIPPALQDVADNDLDTLGLQNCSTP